MIPKTIVNICFLMAKNSAILKKQNKNLRLGIMAYTFNPNTQRTEASSSLWVLDKPGLHNEFHHHHCYIERPCLNTQTKPEPNHKDYNWHPKKVYNSNNFKVELRPTRSSRSAWSIWNPASENKTNKQYIIESGRNHHWLRIWSWCCIVCMQVLWTNACSFSCLWWKVTNYMKYWPNYIRVLVSIGFFHMNIHYLLNCCP